MDGNDYIQAIFTRERHRQFDREVEKDRLAALAAPNTSRRGPRVFARGIRALVGRRRSQPRVQRAPMSIP